MTLQWASNDPRQKQSNSISPLPTPSTTAHWIEPIPTTYLDASLKNIIRNASIRQLF
jgi:hypothetical protein